MHVFVLSSYVIVCDANDLCSRICLLDVQEPREYCHLELLFVAEILHGQSYFGSPEGSICCITNTIWQAQLHS